MIDKSYQTVCLRLKNTTTTFISDNSHFMQSSCS
jgi:hypothetical protein